MGFIDYFNFYLGKFLNENETNIPSADILKQAKILLKMMDDIADEGYTETAKYIEGEEHKLSRLRKLISDNGETAFPLVHFTVAENPEYEEKEQLLNEYVRNLYTLLGKESDSHKTHPFYKELHEYTQYLKKQIGDDTAYVFLLRDTLLPYLDFMRDGYENIYAYPIGRKFLDFYPNHKEPDRNYEGSTYDHIHEALFGAMYNEPQTFAEYRTELRKKLEPVFEAHDGLYEELKSLLMKIPNGKIMVAESGYIGTIPSLLAAVDERVDFRMYASVPFMYKVYNGRLFSDHFEQIRMFETIQCQDALFRISSYKNGEFYVQETKNTEIINTSKIELSQW